jgi:hypothetical protein
MQIIRAGFLALSVLVAAEACSPYSGGGGTSGGGTTTWVGFALGNDGVESGSLSFTASTANPRISGPGGGITLATTDIAASGTYRRTSPTADTVALDGTYNPNTNQIDVSGAGYEFAGTFDGDSRMTGSFVGPGGVGSFLTEQEGATVRIFCGTFTGDDFGTWSFAVTNLEVHGFAQSATAGPPPTTLDGTVDVGGHIIIYVPNTVLPFAAGDITGNIATGTWAIPGTNDSGTWRGDTSCD